MFDFQPRDQASTEANVYSGWKEAESVGVQAADEVATARGSTRVVR